MTLNAYYEHRTSNLYDHEERDQSSYQRSCKLNVGKIDACLLTAALHIQIDEQLFRTRCKNRGKNKTGFYG